jgi:hypothetical protein
MCPCRLLPLTHAVTGNPSHRVVATIVDPSLLFRVIVALVWAIYANDVKERGRDKVQWHTAFFITVPRIPRSRVLVFTKMIFKFGFL